MFAIEAYIRDLTDDELLEILNDQGGYAEETILYTYDECAKRGLTSPERRMDACSLDSPAAQKEEDPAAKTDTPAPDTAKEKRRKIPQGVMGAAILSMLGLPLTAVFAIGMTLRAADVFAPAADVLTVGYAVLGLLGIMTGIGILKGGVWAYRWGIRGSELFILLNIIQWAKGSYAALRFLPVPAAIILLLMINPYYFSDKDDG